jgi:hypothetical protein
MLSGPREIQIRIGCNDQEGEENVLHRLKNVFILNEQAKGKKSQQCSRSMTGKLTSAPKASYVCSSDS